MGVTFDQRTVENEGQRWRALVVAAEQPVVLGAERLRELRDNTDPGPIDRMMVERMRQDPDGFELIIFRGGSDHVAGPDGGSTGGTWTLSRDLAHDDLEELGYLLMVSQTEAYRRFVAAGALCIAHVEFEPHVIDALRSGMTRRIAELEELVAAGGEAGRVATVDLRVLKGLTFFLGVSLDKAVTTVLPRHLPLLTHGARRMRELLEDLPAYALA